MNVRAVWRALVLPFSVALIAILALVWFNVVRIPAQEQYLNERNLRLLRTISAQIKSKVDNFDQAIDNALDSLNKSSTTTPASFGEYVKLFSPDVEILQFSTSHTLLKSGSAVEELVFALANDPPRIKVQRDEGRNYLYLGYKHSGITVVARADIERVVADYLPVENDFDTLLLVGPGGRVIVQQSSSGIELARVDRLKPYPPPSPAAGDAGKSTDKASSDEYGSVFDTLRASSAVTRVSVGDSLYELYIQPVQLSLPSAIEDPNKANQPDPSKADVPEEWALCGLVRSDHFRAASSAISYTAMLWFGAALMAICIAIPLLKIHLLNARERLRRTDVALAAAMSFMAAALVSFAAVDMYQFGYVFPQLTDRRLRDVADKLSARLKHDAEMIDAQMTEFQQPGVWLTDLDYRNEPDASLDAYRKRLNNSAEAKPSIFMYHGDTPICLPKWSCRDGILGKMPVERLLEMPYPYFDLNIFNDHAGEQRIKWTTAAAVTPFLNLNDANLAYFQDLKRARLLARTDRPVPQNGVSVFLSPNTGNRITVFWKALPLTKIPPDAKGYDLIGQSLSTNPISLDSPVLPGNLQFAVLANDGRVLFHSDPTRSLKENFIQECEDGLTLKSKILEKRAGSLTANYRARAHRLYVRPLALEPFENPGWSLVVFQDTVVPETINLYTLTLAASMFALYAFTLAGAWAVAFAVARKGGMRWFWPDPEQGGRYRAVYILNGSLALAVIAGIYLLPTTAVVLMTASAVITSLVASYRILTQAGSPQEPPANWQHEFLWARTSLLLILAVVPALVCFHVAYDFETRLFDKRDQMRLAIDRKARDARILMRAPQAGLCGADVKHGAPCANLAAFITKRTDAERKWDDGLEPFFGRHTAAPTAAEGASAEPGRLHMFLRSLHRPINDLGADLTAVAAGGGTALAAGIGDVPNIWWIALIPVLLGALYMLSRFVTEPLFALELFPGRTLDGCGKAGDLATSLLLIGPPGSGKTARLSSMPEVRTFDVRKLTYVERRKQSALVPVERRAAVAFGEAATASAGPREPSFPPVGYQVESWAASIVEGTPPIGSSAVIGIDHLESRFDDPLFRKHMLRFLEDLLYRYERKVWVVTDREPLERLGETALDRDRWSRVFQPFRKQVIPICSDSIPGRKATFSDLIKKSRVSQCAAETIVHECALTPQLQAIGEDIVRQPQKELTRAELEREISHAAEPYYRSLWSACSTDEKLALRQLAEEGVVNPGNQAVVLELMRRGLVTRRPAGQRDNGDHGPALHIMNTTFTRFVLRAVTPETVARWEREGVKTPWASVRTALVTCAVAFAGFLILTEQQLVGAWFGVVPTLAPAVLVPALPTVLKLLASRGSKSEGVTV